MNKFGLKQQVAAEVVRGKKRADPFTVKGKFHIEHYSKAVNGTRELLSKFEVDNGITNGGKNDVLGSLFDDTASKRTLWAIGQIDNAGFTALADTTDTMASHTGWAEFTTYSEGTRPLWNPDPAGSQAITNSTPRDFNITGTATLQGVFISSDDVKTGTTGILWATALYPTPLAVSNGDLIKITYTVTA